MSEAIVITSGKGGVGKTTACANLGVALASMGYKVVLVDADIGLRNLDVVLGLENRIVYDLVDVVEGSCRLRQALIKDKRIDGLFLLPAAQTRDKTAVNPEQMEELIERLKEDHDYVLVDSPAGIEQGFRNAISGTDRALIVTTPEVSAVRDADRIIGMLESLELSDPALIVNRIKPKMVAKGDMMDISDIMDILAISLIGVVPEDEYIVISTNRGEPAALAANNSKAGQAFRNIARRISGEDVPFMDLSDTENWWSKIANFFRAK
ncbi:MAG TPA: septum site-determining protein MinD [Bacillota bacterium]|nr:septum site-determining protein MinD [Candidatus Fermentithermobacillaceae bacterium]HOB30203.1 septum site-determining protein MinD [Bacillota bacterium]HOK64188.1 septum site-determining protein MinD [Bacillota bacterium]HOL11697.1 septum site-determining protein MinD [Bacillota bacterium]HOQ02825.1 septum site-determining protein MinD [Bacillota bacterium]